MKGKQAELSASHWVQAFANVYRDFSAEGILATEKALQKLLQSPFKLSENKFKELHNMLLFCQAYPGSAPVFEMANLLMQRLVQAVTKEVKKNPNFLYNSGITGSLVCAQFGLWLNQYLLEEKLTTLYLESVEADASDLVAKLSYTLDDVEQECMQANVAYYADWKKVYYGTVKGKKQELSCLVAACMQCSGSISYRENMFANFQLFSTFSLDATLLGLSLGRALPDKPYIHTNGIQKHSTLAAIFALGRPKRQLITAKQQAHLVRVARGAMASLLRETDTFTYAQSNETRYYDMGEGICIALYFMVPEQKFSLQSYIGFMLFKNGLPMAYGGCWLIGKQAAFGVNVLPPFRGGESSKVVAQLLRLYHFEFNISQFTVDPYQIGKGNAEGIESGAFWFYYKLGFRPVDSKLQKLAESEFKKMSLQKNYRSSVKTMLTLVDKDVAWQILEAAPEVLGLNQISKTVSTHISKHFEGNRQAAKQAAKAKAQKILAEPISQTNFFNRLLVLLDALGAFEKLSKKDLQKVAVAYQLKAKNEADAFVALQLVHSFWNLFNS
jgi:hypothetical protein